MAVDVACQLKVNRKLALTSANFEVAQRRCTSKKQRVEKSNHQLQQKLQYGSTIAIIAAFGLLIS